MVSILPLAWRRVSLQRGLHRDVNNPYHLDIFTVFSGI